MCYIPKESIPSLDIIHFTFHSFSRFCNRGVLKIAEYVRENNKQVVNKMLCIFSVGAFSFLIFVSSFWGNSLFYTAVWTLPASLLIASLYNVELHGKFANLLISFGNISFEVFLFHQIILRYFSIFGNKLGFSQNYITYLCAFCVSLILAQITHVLLKNIKFYHGT